MTDEFNADDARNNANNSHKSIDEIWEEMINGVKANSKLGKTEVNFIYKVKVLTPEILEQLKQKFEARKFKFVSQPHDSDEILIVISF